MIQVYPVSASVIPNVHRSCPRLHLFANLSKERKSVMIHTAIAWNVNRMAYIERGYKKTWKEERSENAHIRWRRSRTKQSTQRSGLVQLSIVGSTATLLCSQTCAQKLLHTIRTWTLAKIWEEPPAGHNPNMWFPIPCAPPRASVPTPHPPLKCPGHIADQICIVVVTHDGHPVLAPGYHSLIWFICPNIHVTGQKGVWLDSKQ